MLEWCICDGPGNTWEAQIVLGDAFNWTNCIIGIDLDTLSNEKHSLLGLREEASTAMIKNSVKGFEIEEKRNSQR